MPIMTDGPSLVSSLCYLLLLAGQIGVFSQYQEDDWTFREEGSYVDLDGDDSANYTTLVDAAGIDFASGGADHSLVAADMDGLPADEDEEEDNLDDAIARQNAELKMRRINELLNMIESQAIKGENCTPGTELDLGEEVVDSYGQERFQAAALISVNRANWLTRMWKYGSEIINQSEILLQNSLIEMMEANEDIFAAGNCYDKQQYKDYFLYCPYAYRLPNSTILAKDLALEYYYLGNTSVWFYDARKRAEQIIENNGPILRGFHSINNVTEEKDILAVKYKDGQWTKPYYDCGGGNIWMMTYTVPFFGFDLKERKYTFKGTSGIDIDLRRVDINQCHVNTTSFNIFGGTDKCKPETTMCEPLPGLGFRRGSYKCLCKKGYYFPDTAAVLKYYNGTILEIEYEKKLMGANWTFYDDDSAFQCLPCAEGCEECEDSSPCIVSLNMVLRTILLVLQCVIIGCLPVVVLFTYKYSDLKVVRAASPVLLRIIILGAFFIYSTTIVLYPRPSLVTCTLRIWLREIGFALSYGALMLKTWRISVIFRVRSAKAVKITDMDLIKRLGIILGIFVLFLLIRTLVSPPEVIIGRTADDLKAFLCQSDWWDHSFTILEFLFLLWGIRLCIKVRKAPSEFNESRFISMTIYNEFLLSIFLNVSMFFLQHPANPDLLYIIFFCHSQLTITILLCLIFASKFYLVMKGQGKDMEEANMGVGKQFQKKFINQSNRQGGTPVLASQERSSLTTEGAINAELNRMLMTLKVLQEKNAASGSALISKKILAIQEALSTSNGDLTDHGLAHGSQPESRKSSQQPPFHYDGRNHSSDESAGFACTQLRQIGCTGVGLESVASCARSIAEPPAVNSPPLPVCRNVSDNCCSANNVGGGGVGNESSHGCRQWSEERDGQETPLLKCDYADDEDDDNEVVITGGDQDADQNNGNKEQDVNAPVTCGRPVSKGYTNSPDMLAECRQAAKFATTRHEPILNQICCQQMCSCSSDSDSSVATTSADCGGSLDSSHHGNAARYCHHKTVCRGETGGANVPRHIGDEAIKAAAAAAAAAAGHKNCEKIKPLSLSHVIESSNNNKMTTVNSSARALKAKSNDDMATQTEKFERKPPKHADGAAKAKNCNDIKKGPNASFSDLTSEKQSRKHSKHMIVFNLDDKNKFTEEITV